MTIHTAVIAAAGKGSRMGDYSNQYPKPLIPINGQPFLHYVLESLREIGCTRLIVVAGHRFAQMYEYIHQLPYPVEVINQEENQGDDYGTAVVVRAVADRIKENEPFVLYNGDMLYSQKILQSLHDDGLTHVLAAEVEDPRAYGVVSVGADGMVEQIVEKPEHPTSKLVNLGLYVCQPEVLAASAQVKKSSRGEYEFVDAINALATAGRVKADVVHGDWVTLTRPEDLPEIMRFLESNKRV